MLAEKNKVKRQKQVTAMPLLLIASKSFGNLHIWRAHLVVWPPRASETNGCLTEVCYREALTKPRPGRASLQQPSATATLLVCGCAPSSYKQSSPNTGLQLHAPHSVQAFGRSHRPAQPEQPFLPELLAITKAFGMKHMPKVTPVLY